MKKHAPEMLEGLLKNKEESRYAGMIYAAIILLILLCLRLFFMQVIEGTYYKQKADGNRMRTLPVLAPRGIMYDRNGVLLVGSRSSYSVTLPVDRKGNNLPDEELSRLATLLNVSAATLRQRIEENKSKFGAIYLARDVSLSIATEIEEKKGDFPGIEVEVHPVRVYPYGDAGAQMLGYVGEAGPDDRDENGEPYTTSTLIGRAGIENKYNKYLEGKNGTRMIEVNAAGQPVNYAGGTSITPGNNIRLTIDASLQKATCDAIKKQLGVLHKMGIFPTGASAVALDPYSGAVLAMVSWPSFDPNQFSRGITDKAVSYTHLTLPTNREV